MAVNYKSIDTFEVKGRGTAFVIEYAGETIPRAGLNGKEITIGGNTYIVKGVESWVMDTIEKGQRISIIV